MTADLSPEEIDRYREVLPSSGELVYLNHAAIAPLPAASARAMAELADLVARTGDRHWPDRNEMTERVRRLAARLMGAPRPEAVAFVPSTSAGLSLVAEGLEWGPGDNVVGAACEFPANVYPWMNLEARGVEHRMAEARDGRLNLAELEGLCDDRTRVMALSWVQYSNGFRADLQRLGRFCRDHGILFVVDAIQGLGALELDVEAGAVDVATGAAHKWLLGPEGIGLLYVSDRIVDQIRPVLTGWRSVRGLFDWTHFDPTWNEGALRFEPGTLNVYGLAALEKSLQLLLEVGPPRIEERILELADRVAEGLSERGYRVLSSRKPGEASGIVSAVDLARSAEEVAESLAAEGVIVAHRAGRIRISPHFYNTAEEVERLLDAL